MNLEKMFEIFIFCVKDCLVDPVFWIGIIVLTICWLVALPKKKDITSDYKFYLIGHLILGGLLLIIFSTLTGWTNSGVLCTICNVIDILDWFLLIIGSFGILYVAFSGKYK